MLTSYLLNVQCDTSFDFEKSAVSIITSTFLEILENFISRVDDLKGMSLQRFGCSNRGSSRADSESGEKIRFHAFSNEDDESLERLAVFCIFVASERLRHSKSRL